jgi:hypothetical protein
VKCFHDQGLISSARRCTTSPNAQFHRAPCMELIEASMRNLGSGCNPVQPPTAQTPSPWVTAADPHAARTLAHRTAAELGGGWASPGGNAHNNRGNGRSLRLGVRARCLTRRQGRLWSVASWGPARRKGRPRRMLGFTTGRAGDPGAMRSSRKQAHLGPNADSYLSGRRLDREVNWGRRCGRPVGMIRV